MLSCGATGIQTTSPQLGCIYNSASAECRADNQAVADICTTRHRLRSYTLQQRLQRCSILLAATLQRQEQCIPLGRQQPVILWTHAPRNQEGSKRNEVMCGPDTSLERAGTGRSPPIWLRKMGRRLLPRRGRQQVPPAPPSPRKLRRQSCRWRRRRTAVAAQRQRPVAPSPAAAHCTSRTQDAPGPPRPRPSAALAPIGPPRRSRAARACNFDVKCLQRFGGLMTQVGRHLSRMACQVICSAGCFAAAAGACSRRTTSDHSLAGGHNEAVGRRQRHAAQEALRLVRAAAQPPQQQPPRGLPPAIHRQRPHWVHPPRRPPPAECLEETSEEISRTARPPTVSCTSPVAAPDVLPTA